MTEHFRVAQLAERTGLTTGQLRTWEHRFGFPAGIRTPDGTRVFTEADVARVRRVCELNERGMALALAVRTVRDLAAEEGQQSVSGALMARFPRLHRDTLGRGTLLPLSRAIEDECLGSGETGIILGSFQTRSRFEPAARRWRELARTARWGAVLADFGGRAPSDESLEAGDLSRGAAMRREWGVVWIGTERAAVLSAWQRPGTDRYEALLSTDPEVAATAARVLTGVLASCGVVVPTHATERINAAAALPTSPVTGERLLVRAAAHFDERTRP